MTRDSFIRLTFALHRVADALPDRAIAQELKNGANRALFDFTLLTEPDFVESDKKQSIFPGALREIGGLRAYLSYAQRMNWLDPQNFSILEKEYAKTEQFLRESHGVLGGTNAAGLPVGSVNRARSGAQSSPSPSPSLRGVAAHEVVPVAEQRRVQNVQRIAPVFMKAETPALISQGDSPHAVTEQQKFSQSVANVPLPPVGTLSPRQQRILEFMRGREKMQVWELQKLFPEVTKRTLRRDMDDLLQRNFVSRGGEWNAVFYKAA